MLLRKKGPSTEGVFRKPCNNKNMRDIREQLNSGVEVELEAQPVLLLVGLLKVGLHLQAHHVALSVCHHRSSCGRCTSRCRWNELSQVV